MRSLVSGLIVLACAAAAYAQTPPASFTVPKAPTPPQAPRPATVASPGADGAAAQIVLMRTAQNARDDLKSLMATVADASAKASGSTSNPCERAGRGSSLSCIDRLKRELGRTSLPGADRTQLDQEFTILRQALLDVQSAGPAKRRAARLAEAQQRAERIDAILARLSEPKAPPSAMALPLDKLIPSLGLGD